MSDIKAPSSPIEPRWSRPPSPVAVTPRRIHSRRATHSNLAPYRVDYTGRHDSGRGLIATVNIPAGSRILAETPLFLATIDFLREPQTAAREQYIEGQLTSVLNESDLEAFLELTNNRPSFSENNGGTFIDAKFTGRVLINAIPLELARGREKHHWFGVFAGLSRANHGCRPNAQQTWNDDLRMETLHALHNISPGEEITISYLPEATTKPEMLRQLFGFDCFCTYCLYTSPSSTVTKTSSALNRRRIEYLYSSALESATSLREELALCWERWELIEKEHILDYRAGMVYLDGFEIVVEMGDKERAREFKGLVEEVVGNLEGEDSHVLEGVKGVWKNICEEESLEQKGSGDGAMEMDVDLQDRVGELRGMVDKGKEREVDGAEENNALNEGRSRYERYESELHWLFMIEKAPEEEKEDGGVEGNETAHSNDHSLGH